MKGNILALFLMVWALIACEDTRLDNLASDKVYLVKNGLNHEVAYDFGEKLTASLWANKSGINGTACKITYAVDEAALQEYNTANGTAYQMLPEQCYTLGERLSFDLVGDEQYARFAFTYDPAAIMARCGYDRELYALPLKVTAEGVDVNEELSTAIFAFTVKKAEIGFQDVTDIAIAVDPTQEGNATEEIPVKVDFESPKAFSVNVAVDEALIAGYNSAKGTSYTLLPATAYTLTDKLEFAPAELVKNAVLEVKKDMPFGEFILPLRLSRPSAYSIADNQDVRYVIIRKMPDMLDITAEQLSYADWGDGSMANLLDGNLTTIYNSQFGTLYTSPAWVQIDLGKSFSTIMFKYTNRSEGNAATIPTALTIQVSQDGSTFTDYREVTGLPTAYSAEYTSPFITGGYRYVRILVTAVNGGKGFSMAELRFYGAE